MRALLVVTSLVSLLATAGCVSHQLHPLIGEDPEVYVLLGEPAPEDPETSALAAARRLHQALVQRDAAVVWALLDQSTRALLEQAAAPARLKGRDIVERSVLPTASGRLVTISLTAILFGGEVRKIEAVSEGADVGKISVFLEKGPQKELTFVREEDGWKIQLASLPKME